MACDTGFCKHMPYTFMKIFLFFYSCSFWLLGSCILAVGIYAEVERLRFKTLDVIFLAPSIILILLGILMTVVSLMGVLGTLRDYTTLLKVFKYALVVCLILELMGGILALAFRNKTKDLVNKNIRKGMVNYYDDLDFKNILDFVQQEFKCCGAGGFKDWEVNMYHNSTGHGPLAGGVPHTCCIKTKPNEVVNTMCGYKLLDKVSYELLSVIHTRGCTDAFLTWVKDNYKKIAVLLLVILLPQFLGVIVSHLYIDRIEVYMEKQEDMHAEALKWSQWYMPVKKR
ncbi:tetraspanin-15 [Fundulus heteroclitus]|uniref:tetraspanin-15 n=1 Tax=Fundulus heteroclitus TaxID=8078 RepID=UPI00165AF425|nr:tetraspanin-15 [Fundulus heteroclitus]